LQNRRNHRANGFRGAIDRDYRFVLTRIREDGAGGVRGYCRTKASGSRFSRIRALFSAGNRATLVLRMLRAASEQTVVARPKGKFQCVPTESDAPLKGSWFMRGPRSPFRVSGGVFSCGVWDLSDSGADVRLNCVPLLPIEFDISLDGSAPRSQA
jgi:hypothetical protein